MGGDRYGIAGLEGMGVLVNVGGIFLKIPVISAHFRLFGVGASVGCGTWSGEA